MWKIDGDKNNADLGAKVLAKDRFEMLLQMSNIRRIKDVEEIPETTLQSGSICGPTRRPAAEHAEDSGAFLPQQTSRKSKRTGRLPRGPSNRAAARAASESPRSTK